MSRTYDADFYTWAIDQASALKRRSANELDWDNLAGELETLGASEERELVARYRVLLAHLLKWIVQPDRRGRSWENTIANQRDDLAELLARNPGLQPKEEDAFTGAYRRARRDASTETDLDLGQFPVEPPFTMDEAKDATWMPQ